MTDTTSDPPTYKRVCDTCSRLFYTPLAFNLTCPRCRAQAAEDDDR